MAPASSARVILNAIVAGEGPPLVLLHGLFGQATNFGRVQRQLARKFRVIALDLRNHGASPHHQVMGYPDMAEDVVETLQTYDALPTALLGHSMGGKVAMQTALQTPDAVTSLLVADIAPVTYPPGFRDFADAMAALPISPKLTRAEADAALAPIVNEPGVRAFLLQNLRFGEDSGWKIGLPEIATALPLIEAWQDTDVSYAGPTLFIAGERSDYITPKQRPVMRALFPAARFVTLKHAGHWLHADNPDGFIAIVEGFVGLAK